MIGLSKKKEKYSKDVVADPTLVNGYKNIKIRCEISLGNSAKWGCNLGIRSMCCI